MAILQSIADKRKGGVMVRQEIRFTVQKCNGVVTNIGKSVIYQPQVRFGGGSIKWYEDKRKEKMKKPS